MAKPTKSDLSEAEIAKRRDDGLRRLLKMPPKPHAEVVGERSDKVRQKKRPRKNDK